MKYKFDAYTVHARIYPVLITVLPIAFVMVAMMPSLKGLLWGASVSCGLYAVIAQVGRDLGKGKEQTLFNEWGGIPTTKILRHRDTSLSSVTFERYRKTLCQLVPGVKRLPSASEESKDPTASDQSYRACIDWLRANTRDKEKFALLHEENINYGFRRNLWGLKAWGIFIVFSCILAILVPTIQNLFHGKQVPALLIAVLVMNVIFMVTWIFHINKTWVRVPAEEYAKRLLEACDQLS